MTGRISRDQMLMEMAIVASKRSTCNRKHVGAIIARMGRPISIGYAGAPPRLPHCTDAGCLLGPDGGCIRTQHAERAAIAFAAAQGIETLGSDMYVTVSPCYDCAKMIIGAQIVRVYYAEEYRKTEGIDLLKESGIIVQQLGFEILL